MNMRVGLFWLTKASKDITHSLVHGHVYEPSAQAVMRKDEQGRLQQLVEFVQSLNREPMWTDD